MQYDSRMRIRTMYLMFLGIVACGSLSFAQPANCVAQPSDNAAVVDTLRTMYAAAMADDMPRLRTVFAPGAYLYDGGVRFDSVDALMQVIHDYRAKGVTFVWHVTQPDVHVHCNEAWVAFVNDGSITTPGAASPTPQKWLESANMEKQDGVWKIIFFQSTRVPPETAK